MSDSASHGRRSRARGQDSTIRAEALERLKALRSSGSRRSVTSVKIEQPIYDTVEPGDYDALVALRREDASGFIVDDNGLGYADDGHEEDWSNPSLAHFSSEESSEEKEGKQKKPKGAKKDPVAKKPPPSSSPAAASLLGNQLLSAIFTSSISKKNKGTKTSSLTSDSLIDDVIAEFAPDEADREKRRRGSSTGARNSSLLPVIPVKTEMQRVPVETGLPEASINVEFMAQIQESGRKRNQEDETIEKEDLFIQSKVEELGMTNFVSGENISEGVEVNLTENGKCFPLNAKIKKEEEKMEFCATAGWKEVCGEEGSGRPIQVESNCNVDDKSEFELDSDGSLPFYIIDAYEESYGANMGSVHLFGKVKAGGAYHSCCVVVKNLQRCVYVIPDSSVFPRDKVADIERNFADSPSDLRGALQEMASGLKNEITKRLLDLNVSTFSMLPVKRGYAFERTDIPRGMYYVVKTTYPFKDPPLPADLKGENFIALLGTHCSALELLLIKRKIKGPSWLSISRFASSTASERVSWCKFEVVVECSKDILNSTSKNFLEIPPLIVSAINLKTIITEKNANEIVSASIICCHNIKVDGPMMASEWKRKGMLSHFTAIRKLDGDIFPIGIQKEVADRNLNASTNVLALESSERALINRLMIELHKMDCDVLVGHNISGFDLDVLLHRAQACKVPSSMWSKIGRLKRSIMPKLTKGSAVYGSGTSLGIMSCIAGRLLCDTYLSSRNILKEVSYSLTQLAKTQLNKDRKELSPHDIPVMFQMSAALLQLAEYGETDAWLSLELMFSLSILPLTRQQSTISGNLWGKTLQGARAQQVECLLLHAFNAKKYMVPDKVSAQRMETTTNKRKTAVGFNGEDADDLGEMAFDNERQLVGQGRGRKGPTYSGGLVLEPKKGLYDKFILLLDFNSLYPSIIQEYNICFTTVERPIEDTIPNLPASKNAGILPELLRTLVERRKTVKNLLKNASGHKVQQLNIQQQALKLTANSIYGCLGFPSSRFYAKPIAELITSQGREILQSTVNLVQNNLNLEVVYGDTDSIMIFSGVVDISKAKTIAEKVIQEVNKKYRCLEIDLDGLYKRMLLLKKKKYAAVKVQSKNGVDYEVIERKGLDMVRRDWSLLSKEIGDFCLNQILSGGACDDVLESIHGYLMKVQQEMRKGEIALEKFIITKGLTKQPEDYPDAKNQPHVQVALRLKKNGYSDCSAGDTIPYIICCQQDGSSGSISGIAQRARHPDELTRDTGEWMIDIDYYLSQQIHPVVSRLCASIEGTSPARLADCLGIDSSKFQQHKIPEVDSTNMPSVILSAIDEERYGDCEPLRLTCPSCSSSFDCPPVSSFFSSRINGSSFNSQAESKSVVSFWHRMRCSRCPDNVDSCKITPVMIANQVKRQADYFISLYYKGVMMCDDETCKYTTRRVSLKVIGESGRGTVCPNYPRCSGHLVRQYNEADLYRQLSYFYFVLDAERFIQKLDKKSVEVIEEDFAAVLSAVDLAVTAIRKIRDRSSYCWVRLKHFAISV